MNRYETQVDAEMAAKKLTKSNGRGYAYAIEWQDHWSAESNKPSFRGSINGRSTKVIEVNDRGNTYYA